MIETNRGIQFHDQFIRRSLPSISTDRTEHVVKPVPTIGQAKVSRQLTVRAMLSRAALGAESIGQAAMSAGGVRPLKSRLRHGAGLPVADPVEIVECGRLRLRRPSDPVGKPLGDRTGRAKRRRSGQSERQEEGTAARGCRWHDSRSASSKAGAAAQPFHD
jgi:hypothetical protein